MTYNTSIKYYSSHMPGMYPLSGQDISDVGNYTCIKKILKGCLVDGLQKTTVIQGNILNGTCTLQIADGKSFGVHSVIKLSGIDNYTNMNTEHRVLSSISNVITISVDESDGNITGDEIEISYASSSWKIALDSDPSTVYLQSSAVDSTLNILKISENGYRWLEITAYGGISNGVPSTPTPLISQGGKLFMGKSSSDDTVSRDWHLVASDRFVYFFIKPSKETNDYSGGFSSLAFGDFIWGLPSGNDKGYNCILIASNSNSNLYYPNKDGVGRNEWASSGSIYLLKNNVFGFSSTASTMAYSTYDREGLSCNSGFNYPDLRTGGINLIPYNVVNNEFQVLGKMPGLYMVNHSFNGNFINGSIVEDKLNNKCYLGLYTNYVSANQLLSSNPHNSNTGAPWIDIYGPWE